MENAKLLAILRGFRAIFETLPSELPDEEYDSTVARLRDSYVEILYPLLETQYFTLNTDSGNECVSIFDTGAERDAYIKEIDKIKEECRNRKITCVPISFEGFIDFADSEELDLTNYSLDEDGAIEFVPFTNPESKFRPIIMNTLF